MKFLWFWHFSQIYLHFSQNRQNTLRSFHFCENLCPLPSYLFHSDGVLLPVLVQLINHRKKLICWAALPRVHLQSAFHNFTEFFALPGWVFGLQPRCLVSGGANMQTEKNWFAVELVVVWKFSVQEFCVELKMF